MKKIKKGRNDLCDCGSGKKFKKCCLNKTKSMLYKVPTLQKMSDANSNDPFTARMMFGIGKIRDTLYGQDQKELKKFDKKYDPILQNLTEAKTVKDKCAKLIKKHTSDISEGNIAHFDGKTLHINCSINTDLNIWFKDFFIRGRIATNSIEKLSELMGIKTAFMFSNEKNFQRGMAKFLEEHKGVKYTKFMNHIKNHRGAWYQDFVEIRDNIEHNGFKLPKIEYLYSKETEDVIVAIPTIKNVDIQDYLEGAWNNMFRLCEDVVVLLMSIKLQPPYEILHIPKEERDSTIPAKYIAVINFKK